MSSELVEEIEDLLDSGTSPQASDRIARERAMVDALVAEPQTPPIYGFTTLLGHLDDAAARVEDQEQLLHAHLVGPTTTLPSTWARLLLRVKLAQLAHGGSGIHPEMHASLLAASERLGDLGVTGNWTTSYSSGDVVPAAWLTAVLQAQGHVTLSHPGDLISLINGHFVSTAAALVVADRFSELAGEAVTLIHASRTGRGVGGVQFPVTLRDLTPLEDTITSATTALLVALRDRLAAASCNPRFVPDGTGVRATSGSTFLDFRLTGALSQTIQTTAQLGAYLKAVISAQTSGDPHDSSARVQPTKVAEALLQEISTITLPTHFALAESLGVEDVADHSLTTASLLARALSRLDSLIGLADSVVGARRSHQPGLLTDVVDLPSGDKVAVLAHLTA